MSLTVSPITSHVGIARVWEWQVTRDGRTVRRCMTQADAEQQARSLMKPQRPDHPLGGKWRTRSERPWGWSEINGGEDLPAHVSGLCESGWHTDCAQLPLTATASAGQCSCPCHQCAPMDDGRLF